MSTDTNTLQYWINWRFLLCVVWVLCPMVAAAVLICKYEGPSHGPGVGVVYSDESWRPCFKHLNPAWLLVYRLLSFFFLLSLLFLNFSVDGLDSLFYYTIWTFFLVTLYFAIGSVLSIHGCRQYRRWHGCTERRALIVPDSDSQLGTYVPPTIEGSPYPTNSNANSSYGTDQTQKGICFPQVADDREIAGFWGYLFQIIYQTNAGAVMITDCVFWFVIFPFRAMKDYDFNLVSVKIPHDAFGWNTFCECCLLDRGYYSKQLAISMVQNRILPSFYRNFCNFPVGVPCLCFDVVALPVHGPIITSIPSMVLCSGSTAPAVLCCVSIGYEIETLSLVKVLSSFLPFAQVNAHFVWVKRPLCFIHLQDSDISWNLTSQNP
ncbi:hypothetical protein LUZ63_018813 [Rhynchospora breviuscula]|uniref:Uncharacterized protein n=1 Tax=Rhynchospora breviuscula TaxID=2022672 RepID=A0A9Q0C527_9POAL|nr:hypothetical protein LUZ63_018813 [Rhynchospora breviuscula]